MFRPIHVFFPYAYGPPVRIRAAHTGITDIPWFAHMRMSARTLVMP